MGKYDGLGNHLREDGFKVITLTFSEIEKILGFPLPNSARKYRPWWANDEYHVQAKDGWLSVSYQTEAVNMTKQKVTFRKIVTLIQNSKDETKTINPDFNPSRFEKFAQRHMGNVFNVVLSPRKKENWPKLFDLVSNDFSIVGDAKYLSMVRGKYLPPAKLSVISDHVWMLEKIDARKKFLVFGNDKRVPEEWLKRYGQYVDSVTLYYLSNQGELELLH